MKTPERFDLHDKNISMEAIFRADPVLRMLVECSKATCEQVLSTFQKSLPANRRNYYECVDSEQVFVEMLRSTEAIYKEMIKKKKMYSQLSQLSPENIPPYVLQNIACAENVYRSFQELFSPYAFAFPFNWHSVPAQKQLELFDLLNIAHRLITISLDQAS